jgi:hypothetical protein
MGTSLADLLDALDNAAARLPDHPAARAEAAAALGHLGGALTHLKVDGISAEVGDERERRVATLGMLCTGLAARAPVSDGRVATLAAAAADAIGVLRHDTTFPARWAITVEVIDTVASLADVIDRGYGATPAADWVTEIQNHALRVQREAALHPPGQRDSIVLDRALPDPAWHHSRDAATVITAATVALVHATRATAPPLSIAAVLAISAACQTLSTTGHTLRAIRPGPVNAGDSTLAAPNRDASGPTSAASDDVGAAQAWQAIRAALQPFHDTSTRPLGTLPLGTLARSALDATQPSAAPSESPITAARLLHEQLVGLGHDPTAPSGRTVEAIVSATQHLPVIADAIARNTTAWLTSATVMAFAQDLPQRDTRLPQHFAGPRPAGLVHADDVDLAAVVTAASHAQLLSAVLAADVAYAAETHHIAVPAVAPAGTDQPARQLAPGHLAAANRATIEAPESPARVTAAQHDTYAQLQRAHRSTGPRRGR